MESKNEPKPEVIFIKTEPKPEVIFIKTETSTADKVIVIKTEKVAKIDKKKAAIIKAEKLGASANEKKKAVTIKTEKLGVSAKENIGPAAAVKEEKQTEPQDPIKRKAALASNHKSKVTKKAKKPTECCLQETCKYHYQVLLTKEVMIKKYGYLAMETCHPNSGRRRKRFYSAFSGITGIPEGEHPSCATVAARILFPEEHFF
jgi:hypothetical protein